MDIDHDYEIVDHEGFLNANRHGTNSGETLTQKINGNTLHHNFNSYITNLDNIIEDRKDDGNFFYGNMTFGALNLASNAKMVREGIRSTHHLRNFFLLQSGQKVPYLFYYVDNKTVKYAGRGIFTTNPNFFSPTHSKTTVKTSEGFDISIEYRHQNRTRHNMVYKDDCTQVKVTITGNRMEPFKACPYIHTGDANSKGILTRKSLTEDKLIEKMDTETFFMIPTKKVEVTIDRGANLISDRIDYNNSDTYKYHYFVRPFNETSQSSQPGTKKNSRPINGNNSFGGKKRSKRKRVSRRKNRKSRNTKKNRKHAKTRKSRR